MIYDRPEVNLHGIPQLLQSGANRARPRGAKLSSEYRLNLGNGSCMEGGLLYLKSFFFLKLYLDQVGIKMLKSYTKPDTERKSMFRSEYV